MNSPSWDPGQYERFAAERARPYVDLLARIPVAQPSTVVDLGCGPGTATASLTRRWPDADVEGIDSSERMIEAARRHATDRLRFTVGDLRSWRPGAESVDVIVSNATLQWVPEHVELFAGWARVLRPGGALAFQVPAPAEGPGGYTSIFRATATSPKWAAKLGSVAQSSGPQGRSPVRTPGGYVEALAAAGLVEPDVWETTYQHVLTGDDPIVEWFTGTGLRPFLDALDAQSGSAFKADVAKGLREEYPQRPFGTVLPFRRIFAVARRP